MKIFHLSVIAYMAVILWGCNEATKTKREEVPKESVAVHKPIERIYTASDTVCFMNDSARMVVIGVMAGILQPDSTFRVPIDVLYYIKGHQVSVFSDTFSTSGDEELSHYFEGADTNGNSCERFFTITFGYPACGYTQHHLTFSANENNCYFVARHTSAADGAYGGGMEFFNACAPQSANEISSAEVSHEPTEANENIINVSYADSTVYRFDGTVWKAQRVTEKGKVYRKIKEVL